MCRVRGERPLCAAVLLLVLRHGKSNSTDESITEMNEDGSAMIHEARRLGLLQVTVFTNTFYKALCCTHWAFIINYWYLKASKVSSHAANETFHFIYCIYNSLDTISLYSIDSGVKPSAPQGEHTVQVGQNRNAGAGEGLFGSRTLQQLGNHSYSLHAAS